MSFSVIFIFIGFAVLVLIIRLVAGSLDDDRVEQYVRDMGGELLDKSWAPFGPGWFGEKNDRIYEIVYRDRTGLVHRAHVKTSMFSGVYLTRDRIIEGSPPNPARAPTPIRWLQTHPCQSRKKKPPCAAAWPNWKTTLPTETEANTDSLRTLST